MFPSPAISAPSVTIAALHRKNGLSKVPRGSIRIGLSCEVFTVGTMRAVLAGSADVCAERGVARRPASGTTAPHLGQYFAFAFGKAAEHDGH